MVALHLFILFFLCICESRQRKVRQVYGVSTTTKAPTTTSTTTTTRTTSTTQSTSSYNPPPTGSPGGGGSPPTAVCNYAPGWYCGGGIFANSAGCCPCPALGCIGSGGGGGGYGRREPKKVKASLLKRNIRSK